MNNVLYESARGFKWFFKRKIDCIRVKGKRKIFCIGRNKTGTTSLAMSFKDLGFFVGNQGEAERVTQKYYLDKEFEPIVKYCKTAQVFQDIPFSLPETYKFLDEAYPNSKFILTIRDDPEQWYRSYIRFHIKKHGQGHLPTAEDLRSATYICKGWPYEMIKLHGAPDDDIYNKEIMIGHYNNYNNSVLEYFKDRPDDLLVLNLAEADSYQRFIQFLQIESSPYDSFRWENKT